MQSIDISKAIKYLKPTAQFSFSDTDYSTIKWDVLEGDAPTWEEIQNAHKIILSNEAKEKEETEKKRSAALAKLEALGLNEDDLKALGL